MQSKVGIGKMVSLGLALAKAAPYYNLALILVTFYLFIKLFKTKPARGAKYYLTPWKIFLIVLLIFTLETILTILRAAGVLNIPIHINGFFEITMTFLIVYALLLQKYWIKNLK